MSNIAIIPPHQLALANATGAALPIPFQQDILLTECHIAGTQFRKLGDIENVLKTGETLLLKREANNKYDSNAIAIYDERNTHLGYIPRDTNAILARLMDAGKLLFAKVVGITRNGNWPKIDIQIFLKDI
ncbi:MAG: HIRAN domain-containing protein [Bacteroidota bacterium]